MGDAIFLEVISYFWWVVETQMSNIVGDMNLYVEFCDWNIRAIEY